jgi:hypothetical protein
MKSMARDNRGSDTVKSLSLRRKKLEKYFSILSKEGLKNWRGKLRK